MSASDAKAPMESPAGRGQASEARAVVSRRYDIGRIRIMREVPIGSRRSRKWVIRAGRGEFVLKRREAGAGAAPDLGAVHGLQCELRSRGFPVATLVPVRGSDETLVVEGEHVYELTQLVRGEPFARQPAQAHGAGRLLARWHGANLHVAATSTCFTLYHRRGDVPRLAQMIGSDESAEPVASTIAGLVARFDRAGAAVASHGFDDWPRRLIHGDWHPGNLLFGQAHSVVGLFDFDTIGWQPRIVDIAYGALQFSLTLPLGDEQTVSPSLHETLLMSFLEGYESGGGDAIISTGELSTIPDLMIEALVVEALLGLSRRQRMGVHDTQTLIPLVDRKMRWIERHASGILSRMAQA